VIIDMHVHYYLPEFVEAVRSSGAFDVYIRDDGRIVVKWRGGVTLTVPQPHPDVEVRLAMMDELGIDMQVLSVPSPSAYFEEGDAAIRVAQIVNDGFAGIVRDHPDRFRALAALPLKSVDDSIAELERCMGDLGMPGAMILTNIDGELLDSARLESFWERASELNALMYVHPTLPASTEGLQDYSLAIALGFFQETNLALSRLVFSGVFERHKGIRWVFSHAGGTMPFMFPRLDNYYHQFPQCREHIVKPPTEYLAGLMYDTATTHVPALRCAIETYGVERLIYGSDYPHIPGGSGPYIQAVEDLELPEDQRAEVFGFRAQRVLEGSYG
jgi:aminocarboxymuconate-semialdehyde decarboxylase